MITEKKKKETAKIVIAGAAILDVLVRPASEKVFATGSYPAEEIRMSVGGDALNEATVLAALGVPVQLETVLGDDQAGGLLRAHIQRRGIRMRDACVQPKMRTGINVVLVEENGRRSFLTDRGGSLRSLRKEHICMPFPEGAQIFCFASIFVFPHIGAAELEALFAQAKCQGMTVCADMTKRKNGETVEDLAPALAQIDYLFLNDEEAMLFTGEGGVESAAEKLLRAGAGNVIVKCGARGCYVRNKTEAYQAEAEEVSCIDTTGAGDSFVAGFLYALSGGEDLKTCVGFANRCGARAVEVVGATEWI